MSEFWNRVVEELEYKGMNRMELARRCEFSVTNIGQGIKLQSCPAADTALKIADVLGVKRTISCKRHKIIVNSKK